VQTRRDISRTVEDRRQIGSHNMPRQLAQQRMTVSDPEWEVASLAISAVVEVVV